MAADTSSLHEFKIFQGNVNGNKNTQQQLLGEACRNDQYAWDLLLIQEASRKTRSISHASYGYELVVASENDPSSHANPGICIYARKLGRFGVPEVLDVECHCAGPARRHHEQHMRTVAFNLRDGTRFHVTNVYNRPSQFLPLLCLTSLLKYPGLHVVAGDYNLYNPQWSGTLGRSRSATPFVRELCEAFASRGLALLTHCGIPTFRRGVTSSVPDLTWASTELLCSPIRFLDPDFFFKGPADHSFLETTVMLPPITDYPMRSIWSKADKQSMEKQVSALTDVLYDLPANTGSDIRSRMEELITGCLAAHTSHVPQRRASRQPLLDTRTPHILELGHRVERCKQQWVYEHKLAERQWNASIERDRRNPVYEKYVWGPCRERKNTFDAALARYNRELHSEVTKQWRFHLDSKQEGSLKPFDAKRWALKKARAAAPRQIPTLLKRAPDGAVEAKFSTNAEKVQCFHAKWHGTGPPSTSLSDSDSDVALPPAPTEVPPKETLDPLQIVTEDQVERTFNALKDGKAPDAWGITTRFLKICRKPLIPFLTYIFGICMALSCFPENFLRGQTLPIPKSKKEGEKPDYTLPGMWRPVCLLSWIGKLFESIIADILSKLAVDKKMLPPTQMATRGRSTNSALLYILGIVRKARKLGFAVSIICLDQTGAFNHVNLKYLLKVLRRKGVPIWLVLLINCWMCNRLTTIQLPGYESEPMPCWGIPQGSPLSPILFAFFTSGLLEFHCQRIHGGLLFKVAYSDDTYLIAVGVDLFATKAILKHGFEECQEWAAQSGATFGIEKTDIIHFASKAQRRGVPPMSEYIPGFPDRNEWPEKRRRGQRKPKAKTMTILGVVVQADANGELIWDEHLKYVQKKAAGLKAAFDRIVQMTYGLDVADALLVYKVGIIPSLFHGVAAWFEPPEDPWFKLLSGCYADEEEPIDGDASIPEDVYDDNDNDGDYCSEPHEQLDKARQRNCNALNKIHYMFCFRTLGAVKGARGHNLRSELGIEQADILAYHIAVATRAKLIGTEVGATIYDAQEQVVQLANNIRLSRPVLRSKSTAEQNCFSPVDVIEDDAKRWREEAKMRIHNASDLQHLAQESTQDVSEETAETIGRFCRMFSTPEEGDGSDEIIFGKPSSLRRLNREIDAIGKEWSAGVMKRDHDQWRELFTASLNERGHPIPAVLGRSWARNNVELYRHLSRAAGSLAYQLRDHHIGLFSHLIDHGSVLPTRRCRLCSDTGRPLFETVQHLFHECPALERQRFEMYNRIFDKEGPRATFQDIRERLLDDWLPYALCMAMERFPIEQFDWVRSHWRDQELERLGRLL